MYVYALFVISAAVCALLSAICYLLWKQPRAAIFLAVICTFCGYLAIVAAR